jgi:MerR family mercuric resistance operon transcriptional regulator
VKGYTIGELAQATGVHIETIRYYQRIGLLPVPPRQNTARRYGPEVVERLVLVRRARRLTFSIAEITGLVSALDDRGGCENAKKIATGRLAEVERKVAACQEVARELAALVSQCDDTGGSVPSCAT